jgi:DNA-binding response OmpR family regulator
VLEEEAKNPGKVLDQDFIANKTAGFNELVEELNGMTSIFIGRMRHSVENLKRLHK